MFFEVDERLASLRPRDEPLAIVKVFAFSSLSNFSIFRSLLSLSTAEKQPHMAKYSINTLNQHIFSPLFTSFL